MWLLWNFGNRASHPHKTLPGSKGKINKFSSNDVSFKKTFKLEETDSVLLSKFSVPWDTSATLFQDICWLKEGIMRPHDDRKGSPHPSGILWSSWSIPVSSLSSLIPERWTAPTEPWVILAPTAGSVALAVCLGSQTHRMLLLNKNKSRLSKVRLYSKGLFQKGEGLLQKEEGCCNRENVLTTDLQDPQELSRKSPSFIKRTK